MSVHSLQTNQVVDGGYEGVDSEFDDIYSQSNGKASILYVKGGAIGSLNPDFEDPFLKGPSFK
jgi:hypothetical protein